MSYDLNSKQPIALNEMAHFIGFQEDHDYVVFLPYFQLKEFKYFKLESNRSKVEFFFDSKEIKIAGENIDLILPAIAQHQLAYLRVGESVYQGKNLAIQEILIIDLELIRESQHDEAYFESQEE
jgi:hypothetical protein